MGQGRTEQQGSCAAEPTHGSHMCSDGTATEYGSGQQGGDVDAPYISGQEGDACTKLGLSSCVFL